MYVQRYRRMEYVGLMKELVKLLHPEVYVEVGVQNGHTFNQMLECLEIQHLVAVDKNPMPNVIATDPRVMVYVMDSQEFAKKWEAPIDLLFIDADHQCNAVLADFKALAPLVRKGTGMILLHDTHPMTEELLQPGYCDDAWKAADWIHRKAGPKYEICTIGGPWAGLSLIRCRTSHHLAWKGE
jgi:cephalosporin hydroxylase